MQRRFRIVGLLVAVHVLLLPALGDEAAEQLKAISQVGPRGTGSVAARRAKDKLASRGVDFLPRLLLAMDTPNIVAANWYRTIYEQIVAREFERSQPRFPTAVLKNYVRDGNRGGRARRLVLALLDRLDPKFRDELLPEMLDDSEFRSDAVDLALAAGDQAKKTGNAVLAAEQYGKAFRHAREIGQITQAANNLASVGQEVSIIDHMGFVIDWYLLGPFDAPGKSGFETTFPPEDEVDLSATYAGKTGEIRWKPHHATHRLGQLNLAQAIAPVKEAVGYAYSEIDSPRAQTVQIRCGADDNLTVWVNGKQTFRRRQWLNGIRLDRFTAPVTLEKGRNQVLVKICQGPQHKNPAVPNNWSMQLRFCDEQGAAVGVKTIRPKERKGK